eukprot:5979959-Pyramimonas_sp.AAC.1
MISSGSTPSAAWRAVGASPLQLQLAGPCLAGPLLSRHRLRPPPRCQCAATAAFAGWPQLESASGFEFVEKVVDRGALPRCSGG